MSSECPALRELEQLLANELGESAEQKLEQHIAKCRACQRRLDELTKITGPLHDSKPSHLSDDKAAPSPGGVLARLANSKPARELGAQHHPNNKENTGSIARKWNSASALTASRNFLGRQFWIWPLIAAAIIGGVGWWVGRLVDTAIRQQRISELTTVLDADIAALRIWMDNQRSTAELVAADEQLASLTQQLLSDVDPSTDPHQDLASAPAQSAIRSRLANPLQRGGFTGFLLISPSGTVLAADDDIHVGTVLTQYRREFYDRVNKGETAVSKPFLSPLPLSESQGELRADQPCMYAAAPINSPTGRSMAALGLRIRPDDRFTGILRVARPGNTGETYAFDRHGVLLSQSRFDNELIRIGLLVDQPNSSSVLNIELRDPGVNMTNEQPPTSRRKDQPLTRMAKDAVQGHDGFDVDGYRDYRGVPVIGAWKWLEEYDFGVATEMDVTEALAPSNKLRSAFAILMSLLGAAAVGILLATLLIARQKRQLHHAVRTIRQLGQYTLGEKIGSGAMGSVFKAKHALLRRQTAVKLLDPKKISENAIARFEREVQLTSGLTHPNTVAIFDFGRTPEGVFYYAMEYLDGVNLDDLVKRFGPLPQERAIYILKQICASLAEAHAAGLVHRDVKPLNILLTVRGGQYDFVKVLDFGLARLANNPDDASLSTTGTFAGTPLFAAPEAITSPHEVDARADVYAIGATAYFLLTGLPVFNGPTPGDLFLMHISATPQPPSMRTTNPVQPELEDLLLRCLAKSPDDRPHDASVLLQLLDSCSVPTRWTPADARRWWNERESSHSVGAHT